jgi:hypothetical protein
MACEITALSSSNIAAELNVPVKQFIALYPTSGGSTTLNTLLTEIA